MNLAFEPSWLGTQDIVQTDSDSSHPSFLSLLNAGIAGMEHHVYFFLVLNNTPFFETSQLIYLFICGSHLNCCHFLAGMNVVTSILVQGFVWV